MCDLPLPFLTSLGVAKMFDAMLFLIERGVLGTLPPNKSLLPPPGGFNTLQGEGRKENMNQFRAPHNELRRAVKDKDLCSLRNGCVL